MNTAFRATMLAGVSLCALFAAAPAVAQQSANERVYRQEALAHARAVTTAWRRLESYILEGSAGTPDPDGASVSGWSGAVPPAGSGWLADWTLRGVRARYCEDTLLVYLAPERLKGVGRDHRAVQVAPHAYAGGGANGQAPVLHWLEAGRATGAAGRPSVTLPACLSDTAFGGPLPSGRAALAGTVRDPYAHTNERVSRERQLEDCAAGEHGQGRTRVREVTQTHDERGNPVGDPVHGPWQLLIDECRADFTAWENYTLVCHWDAGPPHNRRMEGREIWRGPEERDGGGRDAGSARVRLDELLDRKGSRAAHGGGDGDRANRSYDRWLPARLHGKPGLPAHRDPAGDPVPVGRGAGRTDLPWPLDSGDGQLRGRDPAGLGR